MIKFSSKIVPQPFSQILYYLKVEQAITSRRFLNDEVDSTDSDSPELDELESLESLLKIAGCVNMELVPGSETSLSKKKFNWSLVELEESKLSMQVTFENPQYISIDVPDSIKIRFTKSDYFI